MSKRPLDSDDSIDDRKNMSKRRLSDGDQSSGSWQEEYSEDQSVSQSDSDDKSVELEQHEKKQGMIIKQCQSTTNELADSEIDWDEIVEEMERLREENAELMNEKLEVSGELADARVKIEEMERAAVLTFEKLQELGVKREELNDRMEERLDLANEKIDELIDEKNELKIDAAMRESELTTHQKRCAELTSEIEHLQQANDELVKRGSDSDKDLKEARNKCSLQQKRCTDQEKEIFQFKHANQELIKAKSQLTRDLKRAGEKFEETKKSTESSKQLELKYEELEKGIEKLRKEKEKIEDEKSTICRDLMEAQDKMHVMERMIKTNDTYEDDKRFEFLPQLPQEKDMMIEVVTLTGDVARLKHQLAAADAETKESLGMVKRLLEKCDILEYERDGLRSNIKAFTEDKKKAENEISYLKETTNLLVAKVHWYKNNSPSDQKIQEEREKNKENQKLKDRITSLETRLRSAERERERTIALLKARDSESEKLIEENNKLVKELTNSLEARQKLNTNIDEMEESMKVLRCRYGGYHVERLEKEKEEIMSELRMREDELKKLEDSMKEIRGHYNKYQEGMKCAKEYVVTVKQEKEEAMTKMSTREDEIIEMEESMKELRGQSDEYHERLKSANRYVKTLEMEIEKLVKGLEMREDELREIKSNRHQPFTPSSQPPQSHFPLDPSIPPIFFPSSILPCPDVFMNRPHPQMLPSPNMPRMPPSHPPNSFMNNPRPQYNSSFHSSPFNDPAPMTMNPMHGPNGPPNRFNYPM